MTGDWNVGGVLRSSAPMLPWPNEVRVLRVLDVWQFGHRFSELVAWQVKHSE